MSSNDNINFYFNNYDFDDNIENNTNSIDTNFFNNSTILNDMILQYEINLTTNILFDYVENTFIDEILNESFNEVESLQPTNDILKFEKQVFNSLDENLKIEKECSICLIDFEESSNITFTKCKHIFHFECITEWSKYKNECPICRKIMKEI